MVDMIEFYKGCLRSAGFSITDTGEVTLTHLDVVQPMTIDGKQLVLPTMDRLRAGIQDHEIAFHPACESYIRKESVVFKKLREAMSLRINTVANTLMVVLMDIAADTEQQKKLSPSQSKYLDELVALGTVDAKTYKDTIAVLREVGKNGKKLVNTWISVKALLEGKTYRRVANVTFPLTEEMAHKEPTLFGHTLQRKAHKTIILKLLDYIFPQCDVKGKYSFGTDNMAAPNFHALAYSHAGLAEALNRVTTLFADVLDTYPTVADHHSLLIDLDWVPGLEQLAEYRAAVPPQAGNEGEVIDTGEGNGAAVNTQYTAGAMTAPQVQHAPPAVSGPSAALAAVTPPKVNPALVAITPPGGSVKPAPTAEPVHQPYRAPVANNTHIVAANKPNWKELSVALVQNGTIPPAGFVQPNIGTAVAPAAQYDAYGRPIQTPAPYGYAPPQSGYAPPPQGHYAPVTYQQAPQQQYYAPQNYVPAGSSPGRQAAKMQQAYAPQSGYAPAGYAPQGGYAPPPQGYQQLDVYGRPIPPQQPVYTPGSLQPIYGR